MKARENCIIMCTFRKIETKLMDQGGRKERGVY
jgi:hypothetical protein